ncbi:MAG: HU family DNA-binding protein [Phycisphaerales bacterium]|nr:HU family DNA-binding protein [Phycisphaerales bacterium]MCB9837304.1 HU family DNA-binding protein [Phycisphaera sp.]
MNKGELIEAVASQLQGSKVEATKAVEAVIASITHGIHTDQKVAISGFGTFVRKERAARRGVNPATKQPMTIEASTTCAFKPAQALKEAI